MQISVAPVAFVVGGLALLAVVVVVAGVIWFATRR
jgi:hypothetical protein